MGKPGRKKGSRSKGWWFRTGRGWYTTDRGQSVKLEDLEGNHIRDQVAEREAEQAYHQYALNRGKPTRSNGELTIETACKLYLDHCKKANSANTFEMRRRFLFDLCTGFPPKYMDTPGRKRPDTNRIHKGLGSKAVVKLTKFDIQKWVDAHPKWSCGREGIQAIKRCLNYVKEECRLIEENPLDRFKVQQSNAKLTYFPDDVETAIYQHSPPALATIIRVSILTGARPFSEACKLQKRHVEDVGDRQIWRFPPSEHKTGYKTGRDREIFVVSEVATMVRPLMEKYSTGPLFRKADGAPWTYNQLKNAFSSLKKKLARKEVELDEQDSIYTSRHTFCKRLLGKGASMEKVAKLMGNSRAVCERHYGQWDPRHTGPLWDALD